MRIKLVTACGCTKFVEGNDYSGRVFRIPMKSTIGSELPSTVGQGAKYSSREFEVAEHGNDELGPFLIYRERLA